MYLLVMERETITKASKTIKNEFINIEPQNLQFKDSFFNF